MQCTTSQAEHYRSRLVYHWHCFQSLPQTCATSVHNVTTQRVQNLLNGPGAKMCTGTVAAKSPAPSPWTAMTVQAGVGCCYCCWGLQGPSGKRSPAAVLAAAPAAAAAAVAEAADAVGLPAGEA